MLLASQTTPRAWKNREAVRRRSIFAQISTEVQVAAFEAQQAAHEAARDAAEQRVEVARAIIQGMDKLQ